MIFFKRGHKSLVSSRKIPSKKWPPSLRSWVCSPSVHQPPMSPSAVAVPNARHTDLFRWHGRLDGSIGPRARHPIVVRQPPHPLERRPVQRVPRGGIRHHHPTAHISAPNQNINDGARHHDVVVFAGCDVVRPDASFPIVHER